MRLFDTYMMVDWSGGEVRSEFDGKARVLSDNCLSPRENAVDVRHACRPERVAPWSWSCGDERLRSGLPVTLAIQGSDIPQQRLVACELALVLDDALHHREGDKGGHAVRRFREQVRRTFELGLVVFIEGDVVKLLVQLIAQALKKRARRLAVQGHSQPLPLWARTIHRSTFSQVESRHDRRAARRLVAADRAKQPRLDLGVAQRLDLFPRQPPVLGPTDGLRDRATEVWSSVNAFPVQRETTR